MKHFQPARDKSVCIPISINSNVLTKQSTQGVFKVITYICIYIKYSFFFYLYCPRMAKHKIPGADDYLYNDLLFSLSVSPTYLNAHRVCIHLNFLNLPG